MLSILKNKRLPRTRSQKNITFTYKVTMKVLTFKTRRWLKVRLDIASLYQTTHWLGKVKRKKNFAEKTFNRHLQFFLGLITYYYFNASEKKCKCFGNMI